MTAEMTLAHAASQPGTLLWLIPFLPFCGFPHQRATGRKLKNTKVVTSSPSAVWAWPSSVTLWYFASSSASRRWTLHPPVPMDWFDVGGAAGCSRLTT